MKITKRQLKRIIREALGRSDEEVLLDIFRNASYEGLKLTIKDRKGSLYTGIGNTEGLHGYADKLSAEKWQKAGSRFVQKLKTLIPGDVIQAKDGREVWNIGTWSSDLQARAAEWNTVADLEAALQEDWD